MCGDGTDTVTVRLSEFMYMFSGGGGNKKCYVVLHFDGNTDFPVLLCVCAVCAYITPGKSNEKPMMLK